MESCRTISRGRGRNGTACWRKSCRGNSNRSKCGALNLGICGASDRKPNRFSFFLKRDCFTQCQGTQERGSTFLIQMGTTKQHPSFPPEIESKSWIQGC